MVLGLNHMHVRKILHRDFKALNVFLDDKLNVKLGDMGVAKVGVWVCGCGWAWQGGGGGGGRVCEGGCVVT
jgi:NIMA (never in mitosis gene a)-related kinase